MATGGVEGRACVATGGVEGRACVATGGKERSAGGGRRRRVLHVWSEQASCSGGQVAPWAGSPMGRWGGQVHPRAGGVGRWGVRAQ